MGGKRMKHVRTPQSEKRYSGVRERKQARLGPREIIFFF
jgi:hypothetical protein